MDAFDATRHPDVASGRLAPDEVFKDFFSGFTACLSEKKRVSLAVTTRHIGTMFYVLCSTFYVSSSIFYVLCYCQTIATFSVVFDFHGFPFYLTIACFITEYMGQGCFAFSAAPAVA